jgi:serine/threonine protein kinase
VLNPGDKIFQYTITSALGSGGMGSVYLGQDSKLDRVVAIKFLHDEYSSHDEAIKRFTRESRAASALNHPNIITIYEVGEWMGSSFIVMEYVEGESLRELIRNKSLSLADTLNIVIQAASALSAAHDKGIVHRDIKPENIMRRPDHLVKVLDFGLAKHVDAFGSARDSDPQMTTEIATTEPGFIIGTAAYMSPEQARGKLTDSRTDVWSLGVVLYEMITGKLPFSGETKSDILASILKSDPPPLSSSSWELSHEFDHIFKKALGKDRDERYQVVKDMILDLKILKNELKDRDYEPNFTTSAKTSKFPLTTEDEGFHQTTSFGLQNTLWWALIPGAALVGLLTGWFVWQWYNGSDPASGAPLASTQITSWKSDLGEEGSSRPRFSPDGKLIAYGALKNGKKSIWLKQVSGGDPFTQKQDDSVDDSPLWSPDSGKLAFFSDKGGRTGIWTAPALGGAATLLAATNGRGSLVHWSRDSSTIYYELFQNLYALNTASKEITRLTDLDTSHVIDRGFSISPDERSIAYANREGNQKDIWTSGLRGENPFRVTNDAHDDSGPVWHPDGKRIIFNSDRTGTKQICIVNVGGGQPRQLTVSDTDSFVSDVSQDGTKLLFTSTKDDADLWGIPIDGNGKEIQVTSDIGVEFWPDVSPDGRSIVYQAIKRASTGGKVLNCNLFTQNFDRDARLSQVAADGFGPLWSPDGGRIAYLRSDGGRNTLWVTSVNASDAQRVTEPGVLFGGWSLLPYNRVQKNDFQWSPDGSSLIYSAIRDGVSNIWQTQIDGSGEKQLSNNTEKTLLFFNPVFSADGQAIAWSGMTTSPPENPKWSVWLLSDGNVKQVGTYDFLTRLIGWTPDRRLILRSVQSKREPSGVPGDFNIVELEPWTSDQRHLALIKDGYFQNIAMTRDGKTLAFVARSAAGDVVKTMSLSNNSLKELVESDDNRVYFSNLVFAPDGKTLYFGKQANWQVISTINDFK